MKKINFFQKVQELAINISEGRINHVEPHDILKENEGKDYFFLSHEFQKRYSKWILEALRVRKIPCRKHSFENTLGDMLLVEVFPTKVEGVYLRKYYYPHDAAQELRRNRVIFALTGPVVATEGDFERRGKIFNPHAFC